MRYALMLLAVLFTLPAYAQVSEGRKPAFENVANDFVQCSMFYSISASCIKSLVKQDTAQTRAARETSKMLATMAKETYRKEGMASNSANAALSQAMTERKAQMTAEAGLKCAELDGFMDKYGKICLPIAKAPQAYMDDRLGNMP